MNASRSSAAPRSARVPGRTGICVACARHRPLEAHHVAGRANHPTLTVDVCRGCHHRYLTGWQYAAGVQLDHRAPRTGTDRLRARVVGVVDVLTLFGQRNHGIPDDLVVSLMLVGRGWSRWLDLIEPEDRGGRWTPAPVIPLRAADPVTAGTVIAADQLTAIGGLAGLVASLVEKLSPGNQVVSTLLAAMRDGPATLAAGFERKLRDPAEAERTSSLMHDAMNAQRQVARALLAPRSPSATAQDVPTLGEAAGALLVVRGQLLDLFVECCPQLGERLG